MRHKSILVYIHCILRFVGLLPSLSSLSARHRVVVRETRRRSRCAKKKGNRTGCPAHIAMCYHDTHRGQSNFHTECMHARSTLELLTV